MTPVTKSGKRTVEAFAKRAENSPYTRIIEPKWRGIWM